MLRICDVCGSVDELPRVVIACAIGEAPPVNQAMITKVLKDDNLSAETKASVVEDLHDNTLMLRHHTEAEAAALDHLDYVECVPFVAESQEN